MLNLKIGRVLGHWDIVFVW